MKRFAMLLAVLMLSNQAFAGLRCDIQEEEDYSVEVNDTATKAAFFDNNSWSVVNAVPNTLVKFAGRDSEGSPLTIVIDYTEGMVQHHSITFQAGGKNITKEMNCTYAKQLNSGI